MAFFLIVPSVMIVSIVLVHALAKRLGLRIYYPTLIAVAVLSFMADFAATLITPSLSREYLLRLGLIILTSAVLLTLANRFLYKKELEEEKNFQEEVKAAYEAEKKKDLELARQQQSPFDKSAWREESPVTVEDNPTVEELPATVDDKPTVEELPATVDDKPTIEEPPATVDDKPTIEEPPATVDDKPTFEEASATVDDMPTTEEISATVENKPTVDETPATIEDKPTVDETPATVDDKPTVDETPATIEDKPTVDETPATIEDKPTVDETPATIEDKPTVDETSAIVEDSEPVKNFPLEEVFKPLTEIKPKDVDKPIKLAKKSEPNFPLEEVFKPLPKAKSEEIKQFTLPAEKRSESVELFPLQEAFRPLSTLNLDKLEEITQEEKNSLPKEEDSKPEEKIYTLDELLDKAYEERDKKHVWQAIEIYKKALERYRNDEYAPFVAIDLGNIYKDQALYSNAIRIYEEALTLPAVMRNASVKKEFVRNLEYLRVVRNVLRERHILSTPFNKLSKEILQEIDNEFKKVQFNSAQ